VVRDEIESKVFTMPHGEGMLDRALAEGRPYIDGQILEPPSVPFPAQLLLISAGVMVALLAGLFLWYRLRGKVAGAQTAGKRQTSLTNQ
jgi:hypothetical protein